MTSETEKNKCKYRIGDACLCKNCNNKALNQPLQRTFTIPDIDDQEIISISIMVDCLNDLNEIERHRVLSYLLDRYGRNI